MIVTKATKPPERMKADLMTRLGICQYLSRVYPHARTDVRVSRGLLCSGCTAGCLSGDTPIPARKEYSFSLISNMKSGNVSWLSSDAFTLQRVNPHATVTVVMMPRTVHIRMRSVQRFTGGLYTRLDSRLRGNDKSAGWPKEGLQGIPPLRSVSESRPPTPPSRRTIFTYTLPFPHP